MIILLGFPPLCLSKLDAMIKVGIEVRIKGNRLGNRADAQHRSISNLSVLILKHTHWLLIQHYICYIQIFLVLMIIVVHVLVLRKRLFVL